MSIRIRRIESTADAEAFADIILANSNAFVEVLYAEGITPEIRQDHIDKVIKGLRDSDNLSFLAETEDEPRKAVGCAKWGLFEEPYGGEPEPERKEIPGLNTDLRAELATKLWEGRQQNTVGKRYLRKPAQP